MMNRRTTLLVMVGAGLSCTALGRALNVEQAPAGAAPDPNTAAAADDQALKDDLSTMGSHEYSDEGIPVFLACVDLVAEQGGKSVPPPTQLSKYIARDLRRYGDAWQRMHPDAPVTDVSKIIEVLAVRDFAHGGKGGAG